MRAWLWAGLVVAASVLPLPAQAVESGNVGVFPTATASPWLRYSQPAGSVISDSITVSNRSPSGLDAQVYAVDAAPNGDGGFGMNPASAPKRDAGGWLHIDTPTIHLPPASSTQVGFEFKVPPRPSVGPHYAGIVVQPLQTRSQEGSGVHVQVITRLGVRLYETVPGAQKPKLIIRTLRRQPHTSKMGFVATVQNTGNTLLTPGGRLQVNGWPGGAFQQPVNLGAGMQPSEESILQMPTNHRRSWWPHHYRAQVSLRYGERDQYASEATLAFWSGSVLGWVASIVGIIMGVAGLTWWLTSLIRRYRRERRG